MSSNTLKTIMGILKANKIPVYGRENYLALDTSNREREIKICNLLASMGFIGGDEPLKNPALIAKWSKHYNFMQRRCTNTYDANRPDILFRYSDPSQDYTPTKRTTMEHSGRCNHRIFPIRWRIPFEVVTIRSNTTAYLQDIFF
jgi:hypothetical protein